MKKNRKERIFTIKRIQRISSGANVSLGSRASRNRFAEEENKPNTTQVMKY